MLSPQRAATGVEAAVRSPRPAGARADPRSQSTSGAAVLIGVVELPRDLTSTIAARQMSDIAIRFRDAIQLHAAAGAIVDDLQDAAEDILRLTEHIRAAERRLKVLTTEISSELMSVHDVSGVVAAGLIGHAGDLRNYRNAGAFAAKCGAAPVPCSSGRHVAVRVIRGGDRQLNRLLHVIAVAQVATRVHPGRQYYERKRAEGKTHPSAMRCLTRRAAAVALSSGPIVRITGPLLRIGYADGFARGTSIVSGPPT